MSVFVEQPAIDRPGEAPPELLTPTKTLVKNLRSDPLLFEVTNPGLVERPPSLWDLHPTLETINLRFAPYKPLRDFILFSDFASRSLKKAGADPNEQHLSPPRPDGSWFLPLAWRRDTIAISHGPTVSETEIFEPEAFVNEYGEPLTDRLVALGWNDNTIERRYTRALWVRFYPDAALIQLYLEYLGIRGKRLQERLNDIPGLYTLGLILPSEIVEMLKQGITPSLSHFLPEER